VKLPPRAQKDLVVFLTEESIITEILITLSWLKKNKLENFTWFAAFLNTCYMFC